MQLMRSIDSHIANKNVFSLCLNGQVVEEKTASDGILDIVVLCTLYDVTMI